MKDRWEDFGYGLCLRGDWIGRIWAPIWYYWYCPYPIVIGNNTAKRCVEGGYCGCSNADRYRTSVGTSVEGQK